MFRLQFTSLVIPGMNARQAGWDNRAFRGLL